LTLRVNQSLAKTTAIVNCRSARPPRLIQIVAPFSSRLSRNTQLRDQRRQVLLDNRTGSAIRNVCAEVMPVILRNEENDDAG
jgi:hypothetical protein